METPVVWLTLAGGDSIPRGYWDQGWLELLMAGELGRTRHDFVHYEARSLAELPAADGAVVVLPGRFHADRLIEVNEALGRFGWVLLLLTSDEESLFPYERLSHPRVRLWVMTPQPGRRYDEHVRFIGEGFARDTLGYLREATGLRWPAEQQADVFFSGQVTHERRDRLASELARLGQQTDLAVDATFTDSFAAGLERPVYLQRMANARVAPAPAGPATADSFRFYEALAAGCVPVADSRAEGRPEGYWQTLLAGHEPLPFPIIDDWTLLEQHTRAALASWPEQANRCGAWWARYQRALRLLLDDDIDQLVGVPTDTDPLADRITVIVPTSPIPSHPSGAVLAETLDSVQARLPGCEVIVVADGVRAEQQDRRADYEAFLRGMLRDLAFERRNVVPLLLSEHGHQANATRAALELVRTPCVLFVEHDTPLVGDIPFAAIAALVMAGEANIVRLHHEASVLEPHRHLMLDEEPRDVMGVPLLGTIQWSQRPHVASSGFYRQIIRRYFGRESRTMIEDVMHGVVQQAARDGAWGMFRLFMYAPPGDIKRSTHLDGRESDPKFDMVMEYDEEQPEWAPTPTSARRIHPQPGAGGDDDPHVASDPPVVVGSEAMEEHDPGVGVAGSDPHGGNSE